MYFISFIDDRSNLVTVYTLHRKSESSEKFKQYRALVKTHTGRKIKYLRTDRVGEYMSKVFTDELNEAGFQRHLTTAHNPQQNGVAERMNRALVELVLSMLSHKNLARQYWAEALDTAVYIRNRVASRPLPLNLNPHHLWHGKVPTIEHLRCLGVNVNTLSQSGKERN